MTLARPAVRAVPERAIVLAAGMGMRLRPFTAHLPKALVEVNGTPILVDTLLRLQRLGVAEAVLVVGYRGDRIRRHIGDRFGNLDIRYVEVEDWANSGNIRSVWAARHFLDRDVFLIEGDVYLGDGLLERLVEHGASGSVAAVARYHHDNPGSALRVDDVGAVIEWCPRVEGAVDSWLKTVNVYLFEAGFLERFFLPEVERRVAEGSVKGFYEAVLDHIERAPGPLFAARCDDLSWLEIDDPVDLAAAWDRFRPAEPSFDQVLSSHGGWWRHEFTDHAYLCNPYFPPKDLLDHLRENLADLVISYPTGQRQLTALMAEATGRPPEHLVVANGASELIALLCAMPERGLVVPVPSFNEFEARTSPGHLRRFALPPPTFDLDVDALADAVSTWNADWAVVVTPNNPTGRAVPRDDLLRLATRLTDLGCRLLVDESFVEFADAGRAASVEDAVADHPNLAVLRSLSKVHGVAGLRIGYLLSSDAALVADLRQRLPVWNVNGPAEEFLRLLPRYAGALEESCHQVRRDRDQLHAALHAVPGLAVVRSEANFLLCRLPEEAPDGREVARTLFERCAILVKDCSGKTMPAGNRFLRLAVRTPPENHRLVEGLREVLGG
ncbi:MAG: aminotransferase class I/II-fold pyridoxal phosphate-dependent enzyme [Deltaproteobacteria bacterium]|nr:aminotransferase class I/II-fold pyridoxal phosphate-dependent enzyme [Deltaproteobacteria bacterium]